MKRLHEESFNLFSCLSVMMEREGNIVVAKFVDGEIMQNLKELMEKIDAESAIIMNGIGMLENAVIGYFDGEKYLKEKIEEPAELVSLQGNIGKSGSEYIIHVHVGLACRDHVLKGGHLFEGKVKVVNEIVLYILNEIRIKRARKGNLMEMKLEK